MPRKGMTESGNRKQLPFTGKPQVEGRADKEARKSDCLRVEPQVNFILDKSPWDASQKTDKY